VRPPECGDHPSGGSEGQHDPHSPAPHVWEDGVDRFDKNAFSKHRPVCRDNTFVTVRLFDGTTFKGRFRGWDGDEILFFMDRMEKPKKHPISITRISEIEGRVAYLGVAKHEDIVRYLNAVGFKSGGTIWEFLGRIHPQASRTKTGGDECQQHTARGGLSPQSSGT